MTTLAKSRGNVTRRAGGCSPRCRRGIAACEFALVLPLLAVIAFGCVDLGRAVQRYMIISNAARVGAEYGATHRFTSYSRASWKNRVRAAVTEELRGVYGRSADLDSYEIKIRTSRRDNYTDTDLMLVRVEVEHEFETVIDWLGLPGEIRMEHHVHVRQFR